MIGNATVPKPEILVMHLTPRERSPKTQKERAEPHVLPGAARPSGERERENHNTKDQTPKQINPKPSPHRWTLNPSSPPGTREPLPQPKGRETRGLPAVDADGWHQRPWPGPVRFGGLGPRKFSVKKNCRFRLQLSGLFRGLGFRPLGRHWFRGSKSKKVVGIVWGSKVRTLVFEDPFRTTCKTANLEHFEQ